MEPVREWAPGEVVLGLYEVLGVVHSGGMGVVHRVRHRGRRAALARVLDIAVQTAWGLEHAHEAGLVHQDVKSANVMLELDGTAKMIDFGLAEVLPWVQRWHGEVDPAFGQSPADAYAMYLEDKQRAYGISDDDLKNWRPEKPKRGGRKKKTS